MARFVRFLAVLMLVGITAIFGPSVIRAIAEHMDPGGAMLIGVGFCALVIYFLPTALAVRRNLACGSGIVFAANALIGWTLVGWIACLLWGALGQSAQQAAFYERESLRDAERGQV